MKQNQTRILFYSAAIFNWTGCLIFLAPLGIASALDLSHSVSDGPFDQIALMAIALLGLGYWMVAGDPVAHRGLVIRAWQKSPIMRLIPGENRFSAVFWVTKICSVTLFIMPNGVKRAKISTSSRQFSESAGQYKNFFEAKKPGQPLHFQCPFELKYTLP